MKIEEFNKAVKEQLLTCENMLLNKGREYAPDAAETNDVDRLAHFKKAAALMGTTQKAALLGMLTKHLVSISDMCIDKNEYKRDRWIEKITDSINYLLILRAVVEEETEKHG